jgi:hypothetical protein
MKIKFTTIILLTFISTNAQAEQIFNFEENIANSGKIKPKDFDNLYSIPISNSENLDIDGNFNFNNNPEILPEKEASLRINYSLSF